MAEVRTFRLSDGRAVVAVRGELDAAAVEAASEEITRCRHDGPVVVDLLAVFLVDDAAVEGLLPRLRDDAVTVAAAHRLLVRAGRAQGVRLTRTLATALG